MRYLQEGERDVQRRKGWEIRLIGKETDGVAQVEEGIQGEGDVEEELELSQVLDDSPYMNRAQETEEGKEAVADCANLADHSFPHHHRDCTHRPRVVWMSPIPRIWNCLSMHTV
jgi:hypothetical protein